jgi:argininosuccinate synthase
MNVGDLSGKSIAFAGSGGLDSCTITRWLSNQDVRVVCFTADFAQPDEKSLDDVRERMTAAGAADFVPLDLREPLARAGIQVIQAQAWYEGAYWNTTGIARYVLVEHMIPEMKKRDIRILSHGATGRGNDQVRFQLAPNMLAPDFDVYAPWRDTAFLERFGGRSEMIEFCEQEGLRTPSTVESPYSTDSNLLGLTHEAGLLESLDTPARFVTPVMGCYPEDAPDTAEEFAVRFERGWPVAINGQAVDLVDAMLTANDIGGRHGIGIGVHLVENRFVGIKSRGIYETPGMQLLGECYGMLLQLVLDRRARELFDHLSGVISRQIYQGYWFDLATQMARHAVNRTAELVTGTIKVSLYKGTCSFLSAADVPHSLYSEETASMERVGDFDHADSEGLLRVLGVSARALAAADQVKDPDA